jgi:hypothetical protein
VAVRLFGWPDQGDSVDMRAFLIADLVIGVVAALVVAFVAFPYRGRTVPKAGRLCDAVAAVADKVDPGPAPVHGVLSTPEKSRRMSRRFERVERAVRHPSRALAAAGRGRG